MRKKGENNLKFRYSFARSLFNLIFRSNTLLILLILLVVVCVAQNGTWLGESLTIKRPTKIDIGPPITEVIEDFSIVGRNEVEFRLKIINSGRIKAVANWSGTATNLALILNGPGMVQAYARRDGPSPLTLEFEVNPELLNRGNDWRLRLVNFRVETSAKGTITITLPAGSFIDKTISQKELPKEQKVEIQLAPRPEFKIKEQKTISEELTMHPRITVLSPNGGEIWEPGKTYRIRWSSQNVQPEVNILFKPSPDSHDTYLIISKVPNTGSYDYTVPENHEKDINVYIIVTAKQIKGDNWVKDSSDYYFTIKGTSATSQTEDILCYGMPFALKVEDQKYLKYGSRSYGIDLVWSDEPSFEWIFHSEGDSGPIRPNVPVAIYNKKAGSYIIYGERTYGINLVWAGKNVDPKDWKIEIESGFKNRIWLKNLTLEKKKARNCYLVYGERRMGINLDWGSKTALPNLNIILPNQIEAQVEQDAENFAEMENALSAYYGDDYAKWAKTKAHNWLVRKAFEYLKWKDEEEKYVHYGIAFADSPFLGWPETFTPEHSYGMHVKGIREDLCNRKPIPPQKSLEIKFHCEPPRWPNLWLNVRFVISYIVGAARPIYSLDQFSHYANDTEIRIDGYKCSDIIAQGFGGRGPWKIKVDIYAMELYKLALSFWPENKLRPDPSLNRLIKIENPGRIINTCSWGDFGSMSSMIDIPLTTYLGGNPFIVTKEGGPTWPIWVPEPDSYNPDLLKVPNPPRSKRASCIYLGWALHLIHDLCMPYHAVNKTGLRHNGWEKAVDDLVAQGAFDHLPVVGPEYKYSNKPVYWPEFGPTLLFFLLAKSDERDQFYPLDQLPIRLSKIIQESKYAYNNISGDSPNLIQAEINAHNLGGFGPFFDQDWFRRKREEKREAERRALDTFEYLLDIALKETILMIAYHHLVGR